MALGIDIAQPFQAITDVSAIRASGRQFAIVKVSEGLTDGGQTDVAATVAAYRAAGMDVAGYSFVHPNEDGTAQANYAIAICRELGIRGLAIDCEVADRQDENAIAACMHAFIGAVQAAGLAVLLYDNLSWVTMLNAEQWGIPIWLADPSHVSPSQPCVCWQCGTGSVPGVQGAVDLDVWTGDQASYDRFFGLIPVDPPNHQEDDMFAALALNPTDDFNATVRMLWSQIRTDNFAAYPGAGPNNTPGDIRPVLQWVQDVPVAQGGFGGNFDLVLAHIIDDAATKGVLRPDFAGSI